MVAWFRLAAVSLLLFVHRSNVAVDVLGATAHTHSPHTNSYILVQLSTSTSRSIEYTHCCFSVRRDFHSNPNMHVGLFIVRGRACKQSNSRPLGSGNVCRISKMKMDYQARQNGCDHLGGICVLLPHKGVTEERWGFHWVPSIYSTTVGCFFRTPLQGMHV